MNTLIKIEQINIFQTVCTLFTVKRQALQLHMGPSHCAISLLKVLRLSADFNYIDPIKSEILMNSFIKSQFNYCPLVWMFHDRVLNSKINRIQERALRLVCKGSDTEFEKLMKNTLTTHQHNLQLLMIEIYKTKNNLNPSIMRDVFTEKENRYKLRSENHLQLPMAKTTTYGIENIQYRGCLLWSTLPKEIKDSNTLSEFKQKIKLWDGSSCVCRLCKTFVKDLGFL